VIVILKTQKITDLHERLAPNTPLENAMDLHNNEVGRLYFNILKNKTLEETVTFLKGITTKAKQILDIKKMHKYSDNLVYIGT